MCTIRILVLCGILILSAQLRQCRKDARKARAIDFPMQWRPVPMAPSASALHMMPGGDQHLISITNFDGTNKAQLAQIAHHNAQILRHIKRVPGVPVTQYHNPFPMFGSAVGGVGGNVGLSLASGVSGADTHQQLQSPQSSHPLHHHHHHPSAPGHGKHFIVQTSNVVVHPPPAPPSAVGSITSAPLVHPHPNSLLTSSSNMAQTMVPYGHHHKHQYYSAKHPPAFLLGGKQAEQSGTGASGAYKFLNAIHPSTVAVATTTAAGAKSNYATAALIKSGAVSMQPMFSSTTSRIPIIRDSTLTPHTYHRHTTSKPHPVVGKLQTHLGLATRPKPLLTGPSGPHGLDELSAHQSHLISSLAQFGAPNFVRTASVAAGDGQQKLPRPNQGPPFSPLSSADHLGHFLGKNYATQMRFPQMQGQVAVNSPFGQQQQQHQLRAQSLQHQHHQQQLQQQHHQQQQQQQQQQHQQHQAHLQQQDQLRQQQQQQQQQNQQHHEQQQQQQFQQQQKQLQYNQQQSAAQQSAYNNQQQQSQHEETFYLPPANNEHNHNHTKPVFEPNQSLEQVLREFDLPFKQMPSFGDSPTTRSPNAYLPPSSSPSISPSVLSPFFQQIQQQQQKVEHSDIESNEHHTNGHHHYPSQHSHESSNTDGFHANQPADLLPHFFISSTFAPSPQIHHVQIQPTADDYLPHNRSYHHSFPSESITYHHQQIDTPSQHHVPPFTRLEDEFTLNLVPPPSYAKDTSQFRNRPQKSRGPPSTAFPHLQQHSYQQNSADAAAEQVKALDILNKYNIPAISPLQDANRFAYNAVINNGQHQQHSRPTAVSSSMAPPPSPSIELPSVHTTSALTHFTSDKPNVFRHLNRPAESEYKQHKVMHPSYTGGPKRPANQTGALNNSPNNRPEIITAAPTPSGGSTAVTHSFFTIEDAVTLSPQLNMAHRNAGVRPTATNNQIEASLNRPHEEEITEVITMRATSEDDDLLQHLDVSSTPAAAPRVPQRTKHRRRRPRPSSTSTSTSTTERRPDEDTVDDDDEDEHRQSYVDEQGHWETNRFPSNHRETPEPTTSSRGTTTTSPPTQPPNNSRHRTRTRGGSNSGRPTVTNLHDAGIVLEKPIRSRRPTQRPDDTPPAGTPSRTRASSSTHSTSRTTASSAETTESYDEATTMNLRDNIFLATLKNRRRPPHSTKATTFVSSTPPPELATESPLYGRGSSGFQQTIASGYVTEIGEDTFMTTHATKPATVATHHTTIHYAPAAADNSVQSTYDFEEITLASDIAQTVATQVTVAPTVAATADSVGTTIFTAPATSSSTSTTVSTHHTEAAAPSPTSYQTHFTVVEQPAVEAVPVSPNGNHRFRHRLRPKDHHKSISHNEINVSTTSNSIGLDEQDVIDIVTPTRFTAHPVSVRLPNIKSTSGNPSSTSLDSTTTRTTISVDDTPLSPPAGKNHRLNSAAIQKFDPKNRPRFSVKEYRQRLISTPSTNAAASDTSSTVSPTTPTSTTRLRYPTRSRVLPNLKIKATRTSPNGLSSEEPTIAAVSTERHYEDSATSSSTTTTEETVRKRYVPKDRRNKSTASNEVLGGSADRTTAYGLPTPASTSYPSRGTTTAAAPTTARTSRTRNPTSRRGFSSTTTAWPAPENTVSRVPTIRKYAGGPSLRRPPQPSLRQRIAISQQKKTSTEATVAAASTVTASAVQTTTPGSINKLFNVDELGDSDNAFTPSVDNLDVDDIDMSDSVNTENYKLETAIMKIAKDDHSYRPYAHSSITPRSRSRTTSTTESMFIGMDSDRPDETESDEDFAQNQLSGVDMNGSPSEQSERVADLTRFGTNHFQSVNTASGSATSRRIPGYFTLATEDPILPIEAFFPKMSNGNSMRG